jgi:uncharacterized RDD family membrane protein YckC
MTAAEIYVKNVLDWMPRTMARRAQIGVELQGHIAERVAAGHPLDEVLRQLGDPVALAESYLAEEPLVPPPHIRRLAAKLVDMFAVLFGVALLLTAILIPATLVLEDNNGVRQVLFIFFPVLAIVLCSLLFGVYTVIAEWRYGQTVGKRLLTLRVVRESGARIGLGQSIVRQLPAVLQIYIIDAAFVLFTDKRQRAFEMLSKTRVVVATE